MSDNILRLAIWLTVLVAILSFIAAAMGTPEQFATCAAKCSPHPTMWVGGDGACECDMRTERR